MTPSPPTRGTTRYRCDSCGCDLTAAQALLAHVADPGARRPAICRGALVQVEGGAVTPAVVEAAIERGVAVIDFGADDRAGVTLAIGVQPVGGDQLEAAGAGQGEQGGDRGHGAVRELFGLVQPESDAEYAHRLERTLLRFGEPGAEALAQARREARR